jgi:hypothetical protein
MDFDGAFNNAVFAGDFLVGVLRPNLRKIQTHGNQQLAPDVTQRPAGKIRANSATQPLSLVF